MTSALGLCIGFILDLIIGDPYWMPHPIRWIGSSITKGERLVRSKFPQTQKGEYYGGMCLTLLIVLGTGVTSVFVLWLAYGIHRSIGFVVECIMYYQILATKCLKVESMKVYKALKSHDLEGARYAVSMIVGRDTKHLSEVEVAKAAIETVAENTSDGVIAPLLFCAIGGAPVGLMYKAVNTLDSMIGYQNDKYRYFGTFAAKLDDVLNFIPARLSAYIMILSTLLCGLNFKNAIRIYKRDRYNHKSPNSAHTEAVAAGALGIQLAGDAYYFGKKLSKPTIGEALRPVAPTDIRVVNRLMTITAIMTLLGIMMIKWIL
ncbi:MAG: adenosylcobinamide-phosphate synthase CbiB [Cellulosilyticaceae bacterium]